MSKLTELVRLEDLAKEYQKIIGNRFDIELNVNLNIDGDRENGIMLATRQPYKISNIKAESLQIVLRFYTCCEYKNEYDDTIQILSQLAGLNKGTFESNGKTYRYYSFLDFTRPLGDPVVDTGKFYQALELMGTCLVTQTQGGVLVGNEVETDIIFGKDTENELRGKIEVLSASSNLVKTQEAPQMANSTIAKAFNNTQAYSYSYTILLMKNEICEKILKIIENIEPLEMNEKVIVIDHYPAFTTDKIDKERTVVMTGGSIDRNAGAFVTATLTFQDLLVISNESDEDNEQEDNYNNGTSNSVNSAFGYIDSNTSGGNTGGGSSGGMWGGGSGGSTNSSAANGTTATFYGSGGGGGVNYVNGSTTRKGTAGSGYQGVCYILIPT